MGAPSKDDVYSALREKGIRAIKVTERIQPVVRKGLRGLRKRDVSCIVILALCLAAGAWYLATRSVKVQSFNRPIVQSPNQGISSGVVQVAQPRPRKWLALPAGVDPSKVFSRPHEVFLARYACPGVDVPRFSGSDRRLEQDFYDNLGAAVLIAESDGSNVAELKRIVAGMKDDARKYIGMPDGFARMAAWLDERQAMEKGYREGILLRVANGELEKAEAVGYLSAMGLKGVE